MTPEEIIRNQELLFITLGIIASGLEITALVTIIAAIGLWMYIKWQTFKEERAKKSKTEEVTTTADKLQPTHAIPFDESKPQNNVRQFGPGIWEPHKR